MSTLAAEQPEEEHGWGSGIEVIEPQVVFEPKPPIKVEVAQQLQCLEDGSTGIDEVIEPSGPPRIKIIRKGQPNGSLGSSISRGIAGSAIDEHFEQVVVPTVSEALSEHQGHFGQVASDLIDERIGDDLADIVQPILRDVVSRQVDRELAMEHGFTLEILDGAMHRTLEMKRQHKLLPVLLRMMCIRDGNGKFLNVAMNGPSGTGKTRMALTSADALGIEKVIQPFNPQTTKSDLLGYMNATGDYVPSAFYDAFTQGKVYIADEFDAANPSIALILNAAVANRIMTFPNRETATAHPNFRVVFIMNTTGKGSDHQYTGRHRQDAATLDRMVQLHVPIDEGLEAAMLGVGSGEMEQVDITAGGRFEGNADILEIVRSIRKASAQLGLKHIFSPRAAMNAAAMHAGGFGRKWIMDCCVWKGIPDNERKSIIKRIRQEETMAT